MRFVLFLFFIVCVVCSTRSNRRLAVYFKDVTSASKYMAHSNYGIVDVKRSSVDPTITIWQLSSILTEEHIQEIIESLKNNVDVEAVEEEIVFQPTNF